MNALARCLAALATAASLTSPLFAAPPAGEADSQVKLMYQRTRSFRIPFHIDQQALKQLKEVQLWVSEDSGYHWEPRSRVTPDLGKFSFRASHDGEFWFATRTVTVDDRYSPSMDQEVEPSMKVVIDTVPPSIRLEPDGRRGSIAAVRWEVKDEHLDLKSLTLQYQIEGSGEWRKVPITRLTPTGSQKWNVGTVDALRVRAEVADKAKNTVDSEVVLAEGTASESDFASVDTESSAPAVEQISRSGVIVPGPGFLPVQEGPGNGAGTGYGQGNNRIASRASSRRPIDAQDGYDRQGAGGRSPEPNWGAASNGDTRIVNNPAGTYGSRNQAEPAPGGFSNEPFPPANQGGNGGFPPAGDAFGGMQQNQNSGFGAGPAVSANSQQSGATLTVPEPRFKLQYAIEEAGPNGPAMVELWITRDGGRNWIRYGEDSDKVSPFDVDLGSEGTFGLYLVARSISGLGDQPPAPGDAPQSWVEVDTTPPNVQLYPPQVGTGPHAGKVAITWRASDLHLNPRSVTLLWRADQPGSSWQPIVEGQENQGQFIWAVPPGLPPKFHVRVEATDSVGHRGGSETTENAPIIVDRSRPRSRIIGLDPNARAGTGPNAHPMR